MTVPDSRYQKKPRAFVSNNVGRLTEREIYEDKRRLYSKDGAMLGNQERQNALGAIGALPNCDESQFMAVACCVDLHLHSQFPGGLYV